MPHTARLVLLLLLAPLSAGAAENDSGSAARVLRALAHAPPGMGARTPGPACGAAARPGDRTYRALAHPPQPGAEDPGIRLHVWLGAGGVLPEPGHRPRPVTPGILRAH